jgi:glycosyltransferase involved in cell wall biosynthesis
MALVEAGHRVTVIGVDWSFNMPHSETIDGIHVIRIQKPWLMKLAIRKFFRLMVYRWFAYRYAVKLSFDILYCHDLDTLSIGVRLKRRREVPLIYNAHEIWGYMMMRHFPRWLCNLYLKKEKRLMKYVDQVITASEPFKSYFTKITDRPIKIIMSAKQIIIDKYQTSNNSVFTLIYIGTFTRTRFIEEQIDVVEELKGVNLILAGFGPLKKKINEKCRFSHNIRYLDVVPWDQILPLTLESDAVVCMINPKNLNSSRAMANKQFEAMVCGRPIICTEGTYSGEFTQREGVGVTCDYTKKGFKEAVIRLRDDRELCETLGKQALQHAREKYNWSIEKEKLLLLINNIIKSDRDLSL